MRLTELEPQFYRHELRPQDGRVVEYNIPVTELAFAQGLGFICPACKDTNGHYMKCWFSGRGVPDAVTPAPGRWEVSGTGYHDLSLSPSILIIGGCGWHGYITNGEVTGV